MMCYVSKHAGVTGSLPYHEMDNNWFESMLGFDKADPTVWKPQLGINDIKSIVKDSNFDLDFLDTMSAHTTETEMMSDSSWFGDNDMANDDLYPFEEPVYQVPTPKTVPHFNIWTPTSAMFVSTISSVSSQQVLQVLFDSGGARTMIH
jgi:hypothetical protein